MGQGGLRARLEMLLGLIFCAGLVFLAAKTFNAPFRAQVIIGEKNLENLELEQKGRLPRIDNLVNDSMPPKPPAPVNSTIVQKTAAAYPLHTDIVATVFWVGEGPSEDNGFIANLKSAWDVRWVEHFGGVDDPVARNGYHPAGFRPKENPFYVALPYMEYADGAIKENVKKVYWYRPFASGESILKNRWVKIMANKKTVFAQWEDVGPFETDDLEYVFGTSKPRAGVGIDVSPAVRDYLGLGGKSAVDWQFVDWADVPDGPWKEIVTTSGVTW